MTQDSTSGTPPDDGDDHGRLEAARREKLRKIAALGVDPWGGRFDDRLLIGDIRARRGEIRYVREVGGPIEVPDRDKQPELDFRGWMQDQGKGEWSGPKVRAAGRIMLSRDAGKLKFINIQDWTGNLQLLVGKAQVGDESWSLAEQFDLGDIIGVDGKLAYTKTGELTIFAEKLHFLTKSVSPPPEKHAGIADPELRQRMRYLDLTYGEGVVERFKNRTRVVQSIRDTLNARGFCEIEGPTLHAIAGGAAARPFITHHNTLDLTLYLRIALELHLKRLLVGGMERVYEIGRVYRNEGISPRHNPEFTMLEAYQAYGNYETMMDLTEEAICGAIEALGGGFVRPWGGMSVDYTPPWPRRSYAELFEEHVHVDPRNVDAVRARAEALGLTTVGKD